MSLAEHLEDALIVRSRGEIPPYKLLHRLLFLFRRPISRKPLHQANAKARF